ncbi:Uncharacterised protein [Bordetella pertussis]|nr:Uncharacterised protein [Bordetella pertussis]CFW47008.1 Uncharacterised protein [Bordetella pertussis]CPM17487.1 Uncharacterised protein [Bordetella pertussis]CPM95229.1 Uncharacterised protein [Bordetella pertussis]
MMATFLAFSFSTMNLPTAAPCWVSLVIMRKVVSYCWLVYSGEVAMAICGRPASW